MTSRYRPWQLLLAFVALSLGVAVLASEVALRLLAYSTDDGGGRASKRWDAVHWKPINAEGYRDVDWAPQGRHAALVFLGDSFTEGHGVDFADTFFARVRAARAGDVAYNLGRSGWSTQREHEAYRDFRRRTGVRPAWVVQQYFGNDLKGVVPDPPEWQPWPWLPALAEHSELADLAWTLMQSRNNGRPYADYYLGAYDRDDVLATHRAELRALAGDIHADGARWALLVFPFLDDAAMIERSRSAYVERMRTIFRDACRPGDVFVDAAPLALSFDDPARVVSRLDSHPSPALHAAVATTLAAVLADPAPEALPTGVEACPADGAPHG
jgi:hypothetical protein